MAENDAREGITDPKRIKQFAVFFKNYMGVSSVVVAALPIPITMLNLIPVFAPDRGSLSVITSLICFLLLAFIFFSRHAIARWLFGHGPRQWKVSLGHVIFLFLAATAVLFFLYIFVFMSRAGMPERVIGPTDRVLLMALYTGFFVCAEAAFVLMATKEYLQDLMGLSEHEPILGEKRGVDILAGRLYPPLPTPRRRRRGPTSAPEDTGPEIP